MRQHQPQPQAATSAQVRQTAIAHSTLHRLLKSQSAQGNWGANRAIATQPQPTQAKPTFQGLSKELSEDLQSQRELQLNIEGEGKQLPKAVQQKMETAFGSDFSDVRIHEGSEAQSINAIAYTRGSNIHFAPNQYHPTSQSGQQLLGHELAHVMQQRSGRVSAPTALNPINLDANLEREADRMGEKAVQGQQISIQSPSDAVQRPNVETNVETKAIQAKLNWDRQRIETAAGTKTRRSDTYKKIVRFVDVYDKWHGSVPLSDQMKLLKDLIAACDDWLKTEKGTETKQGRTRRAAINQLRNDANAQLFEDLFASYEQNAENFRIQVLTTGNFEDLKQAFQFYELAGKPEKAKELAVYVAKFAYADQYKHGNGSTINPGDPQDALNAARSYKLAGDERKTDIWYRIARRGDWTNRDKNATQVNFALPPGAANYRKDVLKPSVSHRPSSQASYDPASAIEEANRHLGRLKPGESPKHLHIKQLEAHPGDQYEEGKVFKKEEKKVPNWDSTIAEDFVGSRLRNLAAAANDPARQQQINQEAVDLALPDLSNPARAKAEAHDFTVEYYRDEKKRAELELHLDTNGNITQGSSNIPFDTSGMYSIASGQKYAIFVMDQMGRIYATHHKVSRVHHTSPLAGGDVAAAGEMVVIGGDLKAVTNKSGHYFPDEINTKQLLEELKSGPLAGSINLSTVALRFFNTKQKIWNTAWTQQVEVEKRWWDTQAQGFLNDYQNNVFDDKVDDLNQAIADAGGEKFDPHKPNTF